MNFDKLLAAQVYADYCGDESAYGDRLLEICGGDARKERRVRNAIKNMTFAPRKKKRKKQKKYAA